MTDIIGGFWESPLMQNVTIEDRFLKRSLLPCEWRYESVFQGKHFATVLSKNPYMKLASCISAYQDRLSVSTSHPHGLSPRCWNVSAEHYTGTDKIIIETGNYSIRPIYYYQSVGTFLYSTDFFLLAKATEGHKLDKTAAASLLAFGRIIDNKTMSLKIKRLPQSSKHVFQNGLLVSEENPISHGATSNVEMARDCFVDLLKAKVSNCESIYIPLSGGIDSRTIAAAAKGSRCLCYTRGQENDPEVKIASQVAQALGLPHRNFPFPTSYLELFAEKIVRFTGGNVSLCDGHAIFPCDSLAKEGALAVMPGTGGEVGRSFWKFPFSSFKSHVSEEEISEVLHSKESIMIKYPSLAKLISRELKILKDTYMSKYMDAVRSSLEANPVSWNDEFYLRERLPQFTSYGPLIWNKYFDIILPFLEEEYLDIVRALPCAKRTKPIIHAEIMSAAEKKLTEIRLVPSSSRFSFLIHNKGLRFDEMKPIKKFFFRAYRKHSPQNYAEWFRQERSFVYAVINFRHLETWSMLPLSMVRELVQAHFSGKSRSKILCRILTIALLEIMLNDNRVQPCL